MTTDNDLLNKLRADVGADADDLLLTAQRLKEWRAPEVTPTDTHRLLAALSAAETQAVPSFIDRLRAWWPLLVLRAQFRVIRGELWAGSALVLALGVGVTLAFQTATLDTLPFVLVAPMVAAIGVGFLYGPANDPAFELEQATPISPRFILLARLTLLFGFDCALALAGSLILALFQPHLALWPLILTWLAPMTFLSALALLLSVVAFDPAISMGVSLLVWSTQVLRALPGAVNSLIGLLPDLLAAESQVWLFVLALLMALATLWAVGREERWGRESIGL